MNFILIRERIFRICLVFQLSFGCMTFAAESPFVNCKTNGLHKNVEDRDIDQLQPELAIGVGKLILNFLLDNQSTINMIMQDCLSGASSWTEPLPQSCHLYSRMLLKGDIPRVLRIARLALSLSTGPLSSLYEYKRFWILEDSFNPDMHGFFDSPLKVKMEPLTRSERQLSQEILLTYWDGGSSAASPTSLQYLKTLSNPFGGQAEDVSASTLTCEELQKNPIPKSGVIDNYIQILNCEQKKYSKNPEGNRYMLDQLAKSIDQFNESRKLKTPEERISAAFRIYDPAWLQYRDKQLSNFKNFNKFLFWASSETFRPIVFIKQAVPTPQDILEAFNQTLLLNKKSAADIRRLILSVELDKWNSSSAQDELLKYHSFSAAFLEDHPEYCPVAEMQFHRYSRNEKIKSIATTSLLMAPLVLLNPTAASLVGPIAVRIIVAGSTGYLVYSNYKDIRSAQKTQSQYLSLLLRSNAPVESSWPNSTSVFESNSRARLNLFLTGTSFALPALRPSFISESWAILSRLAH